MRALAATLMLLTLAACGGSPAAQSAPTAALTAETPTLPPTDAELAQLKTVISRLAQMHRAARRLGELTTAAGSDWRSATKAQAQLLADGKSAIDRAGLSARYGSPRLTEILNECAALASVAIRDEVRRSDLIGSEHLARCANGLGEMEVVYTEYTR